VGGAAQEPEGQRGEGLAQGRVVQFAVDQARVAVEELQAADEVVVVVAGLAVGVAEEQGAGEDDGGGEEEGKEKVASPASLTFNVGCSMFSVRCSAL
jgi:hypothetical protein